MSSIRRIILASGSPRRKELLARMGYTFETCSPNVDENVSGDAKDTVRILAERKGHAAVPNFEDAIVISSDTLVSLDGTPLGKPVDKEDAYRMLRALSGRSHSVYSGVCVTDTKTGESITRVAETKVYFRELTITEISDYVESGEPMDKAGAYGIQGGAGVFVEKLEGSFENVMGFPVDVVREMLDSFGL